MRKFILLILLITLTKTVLAQPYTIIHLNKAKGLSNNNVLGIAQDKKGFLWFATEEGLNRLDGKDFTSFYKKQQSIGGLTGNELNCLLDDPIDSIIWIGTQRKGLNAYDYVKNEFIVFQHDSKNPNSLITDDVTAISPASDGNLWIATYWHGVDYFNKKEKQFIHYNTKTVDGLSGDQVWSVLDGGNGLLYVGHFNTGFSIISIKDKKAKKYMNVPNDPTSLPGNSVRAIYKDKSGHIWLGTDNGLALYNPTTDNFTVFKDPKVSTGRYSIFDIKQFDDNNLWLGTEFEGIAILDLSKQLFQSANKTSYSYIKKGNNAFKLSSTSVRALHQDSFGNIWAGTWGGGVNFISKGNNLFNTSRNLFQSFTEERTEHNGVGGICVDAKDKLWIGTEKVTTYTLTKERELIMCKSYQLKNIHGHPTQAALCDNNGQIWFGIFTGGAYYYDEKEDKFKQLFSEPYKDTDVRTIYQNEPNLLWLGTSKGLYKIDAVKKCILEHYIPNELVRAIHRDNKGRMWIGTFGGGVQLYNHNMKRLKQYHTSIGFPSNTINSIYEDNQGKIWIATGEGLVCFPSSDSENYITYNDINGLDNIHIRAITEDEDGNIWFSTNKGISCFHQEKNIFLNYDENDNIPINGFFSNCVSKGFNNFIFFGSVDDLCFFDPKDVLKEQIAPLAAITDIKIFNSLNKGKAEGETLFIDNPKVTLNHKQSSFSVTFNIPNYALSSQVEYAYMLKGLKDTWYPLLNTNSITFRNIPPGNYNLLVKTRLRNQEWGDKTTQLKIKVTPPLWLTWWAKSLYIILTIAVVLLILHMYNSRFRAVTLYKLEKKKHEQEQELNDERLRFYTNITHELRTPLTLILGPLEDLLKQNSLSAKDGKKVSVIHQSAIRLLNLINQLLEFRKIETQNKKLCISRGNLTGLIYEIGLKYKELNQNEQVKLSIEAPEESLILFYDKEVITIIIDNLMSNAIKYTAQGEIKLGLHTEINKKGSYACITVKDSGYGIVTEALDSIFNRYYQVNSEHQASGTGIGLSLVKNLVALHEGEIEVESKVKEGTLFTVKLLINNTYPHLSHADSKIEEESTEIEPKETGKQILLVVEDNPDIRTYIVDSFSEWFDVRTATNGKEGVEIALEIIPDVIVSDIMMPIMNGTALCEQLKTNIRTSHIPIILLTAKDTLQDKEDGYQAGADSYLTKPFSATLLQSRINNLLDSRKKLASHFGGNSELQEKKETITSALNKIDDEFLTKINQLIEERMAEDKIDISYIADKLCMSNSTLYRKMKGLTGFSTNEYIRKIKMKYAERLLLEGKYTISEIAFKVGINSPVYFRLCFKEEFGMLPSEYLKKLTKEEE